MEKLRIVETCTCGQPILERLYNETYDPRYGPPYDTPSFYWKRVDHDCLPGIIRRIEALEKKIGD